jgi:hypothetical protein
MQKALVEKFDVHMPFLDINMQSTNSIQKSEVHDPKQGTTLGRSINDHVDDGL